MSPQDVGQIRFDFFGRLPIEVEVREVQVSSDAGILPIRSFDDQIGYTQRFIACLNDVRDPDRISHASGQMLRQRPRRPLSIRTFVSMTSFEPA